MPPRRRCADEIVEVLRANGIDTIFGVPGGAISPMYDALLDVPEIRVIHARHETSALFMAIGYYRLRPSKIPCVLVTSGPGVTNAVTGLAAALGENVPVLVLGGEVPRSKFGRSALQEGTSETIDVVSMVRSVTHHTAMLQLPGRAAFQVSAGLQIAREKRGPVFFSMPLDVATSVVPSSRVQASMQAPAPLDLEAIEAAAHALEFAQAPLLLVGSGARSAATKLSSFAHARHIPVITSPKAKGVFDERSPLCAGVFGYGGHESSSKWLNAHPPDVVVALGCGLSEPSTNNWSELLQARETMIQVDIAPGAFGRNYRTDVAILADCGVALDAIDERLDPSINWSDSPGGVSHLRLAAADTSDGLSTDHVLLTLQKVLPRDTVFTSDIGEHLLFAIHYLVASSPDQFIACMSLGSMGSGIGAAVGAKIAAPERTVVSIVGDYGFQMFGMELATCVQEKTGVVFAIMNDRRMRMVEAGLERVYGRSMPVDGPLIDFAALAVAHGAKGLVIRTISDLEDALAELPGAEPVVLDIRLRPDCTFAVNARVESISNFASQ